MPTSPAQIDSPDAKCAFGIRCSQLVLGRGGLDVHHEFPLSLGGEEGKTEMLTLCPNHHRRQHALIRLFIENFGEPIPPWVHRRFHHEEVQAAIYAIQNWITAGKPHVSWSVPAARDLETQ
jgi:5-methylcytosine-specific restriction endonuclease McrA